jgi:hypothetical protein
MSEPSPTSSPIICFGQQPCGFFPKRFLVAKIFTARRLQAEIGGEIVFFYHDSDHDPRETRTIVRHRQSGGQVMLNFEFENKLQRKHSPAYAKRVPAEWQRKTAQGLGNYVDKEWVAAFQETTAANVADFCLEMYRKMGLMEAIRVARSGDAMFREAACDVEDYFVDVPYEGEIVRARLIDGKLKLHEGGDSFVTLPDRTYSKAQISPARDTRLKWMQSVVHCTHYICGAGEQQYLRKEDAREVIYAAREGIDRSDESYTPPIPPTD